MRDINSISGELSGYLTTAQCPIGLCCRQAPSADGKDPGGCAWSDRNKTDGTGMCAPNRDPNVPFCGKCLEGYSETQAPDGTCAICKGSAGMAVFIFPGLLGFGAVAFWLRKGLKEKEDLPVAAVVYVTKSLIFFYQLLPYLAFQTPVEQLQPLAELFSLNFNLDTGSGEDGAQCLYSGMGARSKILSELASSCLFTIDFLLVGLLYFIPKSKMTQP